MTVPNYSSRADYDRMYALGVTQYGQMTAGSYMYIGPQGIVHGTTLVLMAAARKYLNSATPALMQSERGVCGAQPNAAELLKGKIFLSSGLGGMSGAQPKAGVIAGAITVVAEVDAKALDKRYSQGWVQERIYGLDELVARLRVAKKNGEVVSLGYLGNVVDVWERMASEAARVASGEISREDSVMPDIGSDQTSLHNPSGGYYPVGMSFDEAKHLLATDPPAFRAAVQASLRRHVAAVNACAQQGMRFFDYGNCFLLECFRSGADILAPELKADPVKAAAATETTVKFAYPSYVQEFMGENIFSLGFGPFRWVCCSGNPEDLRKTDAIAAKVIRDILSSTHEDNWAQIDEEAVWARQTKVGADGKLECMKLSSSIEAQLRDNLAWVEAAGANKLVVGSQARILYADGRTRVAIAAAMNEAVAKGEIGPVVLSRDHHDVSGTDSPFRETSNVFDGSQFTADMAVQNVIGDAMRGATWVALHNGGGVGWGEVTNGGFGHVLDGSQEAGDKARSMLFWDVHNGVNRRAYSGSACANYAIARAEQAEPRLQVTRATHVDPEFVKKLINKQ
jgi:urocanate hydratase